MVINFKWEKCNNFKVVELWEWLVINGIGGYVFGIIVNFLICCYYGLLIVVF